MDSLPIAGVAAISLYLIILFVKAYLSRRYANRFNRQCEPDFDITIMQPILSGDPSLEATLRQNLQIQPKHVRFLWLVDKADQVGLEIAQRLANSADTTVEIVLCPPVEIGVNPKIFKLQYGLNSVKTPYLAVLDDDTVLSPESLGNAVFHLKSAGLYTGLPRYTPGENIWSALVAGFVNNNSILTYLPLLNFMPPLSINGMFYVVETKRLQKMAGFSTISDKLCDDYAVANLVKKHGENVVQGTIPQTIQTTVSGPKAYIALLHRWFLFANVLLRDQKISALPILFLLLGIHPFLLWISFFALLQTLSGAVLLVFALGMRYGVIRWLHRKIFGKSLRLSFLLSVLSELLQPFHWLHASFYKTIRWRTRRIRLEKDGRFSYL